MAYFDRTIPPGGEGKITIKVNTRGYSGRLRKTARVYTNDPWHPSESLKIEAFIKTLINLSPRYVLLQGSRSEKITKTVPLQRGGTPNDVAEAVIFLFENEYITGETIIVDGGRTLV